MQSLLRILAPTAAIVIIAGCASAPKNDGGDPHQGMNRAFYDFNDTIDRKFFKPVAEGYVKVTPEPVRGGVTNFFSNATYLNTVANNLLQGKFGAFFNDSSRFVINSTIGLGGLFDPAKEMGLTSNDEDFGQTLGTWGAGEGAYLVLPFLGPNSYRDVPGVAVASLLNPISYLNPIVTIPVGVLSAINTRANLLEASNIRDQAALDPYTFVREAYRQQRDYKIYDGNPPGDNFDEYLESESDGAILKIY